MCWIGGGLAAMRLTARRVSALIALAGFPTLAYPQPYFGNGVKVGEVTDSSAILWVRLTARSAPDFARMPVFTQGVTEQIRKDAMPEDVLPGCSGEVEIRYWPTNDKTAMTVLPWQAVLEERDHTLQTPLSDLLPGTQYAYGVTARGLPQGDGTARISGQFRTAPLAADDHAVRFFVTTCQAIGSVDAGANGHRTYAQMKALEPDFFVHTGDFVYYDKVPLARSMAAARAKWNLMSGYGYLRDFLGAVSAYFMKDDHDTLDNDCWPGQRYGELTFAEGQAIFREQVPMGELPYRTVRWGRHLQIWMTENRDYRSPNTDPDGPHKTILGPTQKAWLRQTLLASDATFKIVISPGPILGPDKPGKKDNHSNATFLHEGDELRALLAGIPNTYVVCGDRHWQYCSRDPESGLTELGCGPINDEHDYGGDPGYDPDWHLYFDSGGGFLEVMVRPDAMTATWFHTDASSGDPAFPRIRHQLHFAVQ
jgi:alkaline phosphatase D